VRGRGLCPMVRGHPMLTSRSCFLGAIALVASCGEPSERNPDPSATALEAKSSGTSIEISELDISQDEVDRFVNCPPPGELGQDWIPPLPPWTPPASTGLPDATPLPAEVASMHGSTPTERAIADTRESFRACYNHGLVYDPTQDGHVAIVLRVGPDGRVARVESWGACEIARQSIECMRAAAKKLRFRPPTSGSDTVTIPAVFTSSEAVRRTSPRPSDVYTASAYIALEKLRPELHACEQGARQGGRTVMAAATLNLQVDDRGRVHHSNVEPWTGNKELLACAANVLGGLKLPAPPGSKANVIVRVAFNPREGTK
jgi:hypothetical protein